MFRVNVKQWEKLTYHAYIIDLTHVPQPKYLETNAINFRNILSSLKVIDIAVTKKCTYKFM